MNPSRPPQGLSVEDFILIKKATMENNATLNYGIRDEQFVFTLFDMEDGRFEVIPTTSDMIASYVIRCRELGIDPNK